MIAIRNAAIVGMVALLAMLAAMMVLTWDQYVYATTGNMVAIATFALGVVAAFMVLFGIMVSAHDNR